MADNDCLFCKLVKGDINSWIIYQDEEFLAFLNPFPSIEGMTMVIPKRHMSEDIWGMKIGDRNDFLDVITKVSERIIKVMEVSKVALVFEGEAVPHVHAKLFPMHDKRGVSQTQNGYYERYPGFIDTRSGPKMDDKKLDELRDRLRF